MTSAREDGPVEIAAPPKVVEAKALVLAADGLANNEVARRCHIEVLYPGVLGGGPGATPSTTAGSRNTGSTTPG